MPPIRNGDGTDLAPKGFAEVRKGDGTILWSGDSDGDTVPDSDNLQAHYVASSIDASDGDSVSTWPDSAGSNDATGGDPTFREDEIGGEPAVEFDATDDYLDTNYEQNTNDARSLYIVAKAPSGYGHWYGAYDSSGDGNRTYFGVGVLGWMAAYGDELTEGNQFDETGVVIGSLVAGSGSVDVYVDGEHKIGGSYNGVGPTGYNDFIGARNMDGSADSYFEGAIAEILRYDVEHGSSTRSSVESYLNDKYGVY